MKSSNLPLNGKCIKTKSKLATDLYMKLIPMQLIIVSREILPAQEIILNILKDLTKYARLLKVTASILVNFKTLIIEITPNFRWMRSNLSCFWTEYLRHWTFPGILKSFRFRGLFYQADDLEYVDTFQFLPTFGFWSLGFYTICTLLTRNFYLNFS